MRVVEGRICDEVKREERKGRGKGNWSLFCAGGRRICCEEGGTLVMYCGSLLLLKVGK